MSSPTIRDQAKDHLLTPKNAAVVVIDYQPVQIETVLSMDRKVLVDNIVRVAELAKLFEMPIVLSTVNVATGFNKPMIPELQAVFPNVEPLDRTTINAWEDVEFVEAVRATGRKKIVLAALYTEACLTYPALDMLLEGYEVYPLVDAVGGTSVEAHRAALERVTQAGAKQTSVVQMACELQRDWNRTATAIPFYEILAGHPIGAVAVDT
jgi:nicotinamidase-related amidase